LKDRRHTMKLTMTAGQATRWNLSATPLQRRKALFCLLSAAGVMASPPPCRRMVTTELSRCAFMTTACCLLLTAVAVAWL
jgi:hypothetical protein